MDSESVETRVFAMAMVAMDFELGYRKGSHISYLGNRQRNRKFK